MTTPVIKPNHRQGSWAWSQPRISREHVTSPSPNDYHKYISPEESYWFWIGYLIGYRTKEKDS